MGGLAPEGSALAPILRKRVSLVGTTLRNRSDAYKADLVARFEREALPKLASGAFTPVIHAEFGGLEEAQAAHELMESNANTGKILIRVAGE
jgi:NADPH:quinone reductase-like Zn-dependent oxidoreductase